MWIFSTPIDRRLGASFFGYPHPNIFSWLQKLKNLESKSIPPTTQNKIIPLEIKSPLSLAISCSAWVHKCMGAQKKGEGVHWRALTLF